MSATAKLELKIGGMACALCVASIGKRLGGMRGVRGVDARLAVLLVIRRLWQRRHRAAGRT